MQVVDPKTMKIRRFQNSGQTWFLNFIEANCYYCKIMEAIWGGFWEKHKKDINIAKIDCDLLTN